MTQTREGLINAIISFTVEGHTNIATLLLHSPELQAGFSSYYRDFKNLKDTITRWQRNDEKLYDDVQPVFVPTRDLWKIREYTWTRETSRLSPDEWDLLTESIRRQGWDEQDPAIVLIGRKGGVKVGEGNHRLAIAREAGIKNIPVRFVFYESKVRKNPQRVEQEFKKKQDKKVFPPSYVYQDRDHETTEEKEKVVEDIMRLLEGR